ncbi:MAG: 30S ribosomal protein S19 [Mycoplasmataceae bacterium RV_VA103A]|nr:MAG: 30S ribosomal protein S19 [Mycoplasmataceae bacterium RV_VA103A]
MSRSLKKPLNVNEKLLKKFQKANQEGKIKTFKIWDRGSVIPPEAIGQIALIHNGKIFFKRQVIQNMVGKKWGQFSPTRQAGQHGKAGTH